MKYCLTINSIILFFLFSAQFGNCLSNETSSFLTKLKNKIKDSRSETCHQKNNNLDFDEDDLLTKNFKNNYYSDSNPKPKIILYKDNVTYTQMDILTKNIDSEIEDIDKAKNAINTYVPNQTLKSVILVPLNIGNTTKQYFKRTLDMDLGYEDSKILLLKKSKW